MEEALRRLVRQHPRRAIAALAGVGWTGNLDEMRRERTHDCGR